MLSPSFFFFFKWHIYSLRSEKLWAENVAMEFLAINFMSLLFSLHCCLTYNYIFVL